MGGKLITKWGFPEKRIPAKEYFDLEADVRGKCRIHGVPIGVRMITIPAYRQKESFGDLDVLIEHTDVEGKSIDFRKVVKDAFKFDDPHVNAGVYSFPYRDFQVDLITVHPDEFDTAKAYFSWNDCGNLCGRIFHTLGMSYGHEGLYYIVREETVGVNDANNSHVLKEVPLSTDPKRILTLVGLDYEHFEAGFDTLEEMFEWVCASPYFNADKYKFEELNHINRTRNRKRASYAYFVQWLETNAQRFKKYEGPTRKLDHLPWILKEFPHLQAELDQCKKGWEDAQTIKAKFNGDLVGEWTGVTDGKILGEIIRNYREYIMGDEDKERFKKYHLDHDADYIKGQFTVWYDHKLQQGFFKS